LKSYVGQAAIVAYFQQHPGNDAFISAIFSSIKDKKSMGPNQARKEGGGSQPHL
jgi:hypothetical protein